MIRSKEYGFRRIVPGDLALLSQWRSRAHVQKWWGTDDGYDADELADPRVARWIVSTDGQPFAFLQDYSVHGWEDHHFADLPVGSRGIDQFIGDPELIGLGHGPAFISQRVDALFSQGVPVIATDPHPDNAQAIAAYKKLGFEPSGPPKETQWGLILPMQVRP